jgi:hypothetical protein
MIESVERHGDQVTALVWQLAKCHEKAENAALIR